MSYSFRFVESPRRLWIEFSGTLSDDEIRTFVSTVLGDPQFEPGLDVLSDHTRLAEAITMEQFYLLLSLFQARPQRLRGVRMAIVTRRDASFGMMRMLSAKVESIPMTVEVFRDLAAAEVWLQSGL